VGAASGKQVGTDGEHKRPPAAPSLGTSGLAVISGVLFWLLREPLALSYRQATLHGDGCWLARRQRFLLTIAIPNFLFSTAFRGFRTWLNKRIRHGGTIVASTLCARPGQEFYGLCTSPAPSPVYWLDTGSVSPKGVSGPRSFSGHDLKERKVPDDPSRALSLMLGSNLSAPIALLAAHS